MHHLYLSKGAALCVLALGLSSASTASDLVTNCNPSSGETLFKKCAVCHTHDSSGKHGVVGPNLYQIIDRPVGKASGYKFSSSLRKSGDSWTIDLMDSFLKQPMGVYPRTRMAFSGISNPQHRADIICYLSATSTTHTAR